MGIRLRFGLLVRLLWGFPGRRRRQEMPGWGSARRCAWRTTTLPRIPWYPCRVGLVAVLRKRVIEPGSPRARLFQIPRQRPGNPRAQLFQIPRQQPGNLRAQFQRPLCRVAKAAAASRRRAAAQQLQSLWSCMLQSLCPLPCPISRQREPFTRGFGGLPKQGKTAAT